MSEERDSNLGEGLEIKEILENGFGEVEFEEIKIGFKETHEESKPSKDLTDDDLIEFLSLGFMSGVFETEEVGKINLEETLSNIEIQEKEEYPQDKEFYKTENNPGETYELNTYDPREAYDETPEDAYSEGFVDINDINISIKSEEGKREERSMLEISGFKDVDAEKKREDRRRFWDY